MNNKCSINNNGCLGNNIDDCDKLSCVYNSNKLLDLICTTKLIYESIHNDISEYIYNLASLQEYYGQSDLNEEDMFNCLINWYNQLVLILYVQISNHLSTSTSVEGRGTLVINKWTNEEKITTLKYQNVCERLIDLDNCKDEFKYRIPHRYYGKGDEYLVQYSKNILTYDNIILNKVYLELSDIDKLEEIKDGSVIVNNIDIDNYDTLDNNVIIFGLNFKIGNYGDFIINNGTRMKFELQPSGEGPNNKTISQFYKFIDHEQKKLCELQRIIQNNIDFIQKYKDKFILLHPEFC